VTATLAELYVKQGLIGRAREIYRRLAEQGDPRAKQRLAELPSSGAEIEVLQALLARVKERKQLGPVTMKATNGRRTRDVL
jgi:lipopolysaccharide biosynthesis regulator YciM